MCSFERGEILLRPWFGLFDALSWDRLTLWGSSDSARAILQTLYYILNCNLKKKRKHPNPLVFFIRFAFRLFFNFFVIIWVRFCFWFFFFSPL